MQGLVAARFAKSQDTCLVRTQPQTSPSAFAAGTFIARTSIVQTSALAVTLGPRSRLNSSCQTRTYSCCHVPGEADGTLYISVSQTSWHQGPPVTNTVHPSRKLFHLACPLYATRGCISLSSNQRTYLLPKKIFFCH